MYSLMEEAAQPDAVCRETAVADFREAARHYMEQQSVLIAATIDKAPKPRQAFLRGCLKAMEHMDEWLRTH
jgi:hypothetical protein